MHLLSHSIRYIVISLLLLVFSSVAVGDEVYRDVVLLLDKGTDLRSIKSDIETVFEQLEQSENNTRIAVIGFDVVVTDIASLSLASEGGGKVLLDALTNKEDVPPLTNVAAGIERGISELTSQEAVARSKTIIVFSDGKIQTGDEQSDQDYRSWLADVLTQSAVRAEIRIFWMSTASSTSGEFIQKITQSTGGRQYLIDKVAEGEWVKDVLAVAPATDESKADESITNEEIRLSEIPESVDVALEPESESLEIETAAEASLQDITPAESANANEETIVEVTEEPEAKTSAVVPVTDNITQYIFSLSLPIKQWIIDAVKTSKELISTQTDKRVWVLALLGLLMLMIAGVLLLRLSASKKIERVEPVITGKLNQAPDLPPVGATEELFIDAVMQKAESAKKASMDPVPSATRKSELKEPVQKVQTAKLNQPQAAGVKIRDKSLSNDRTAIRPAQK